MLLVHVCKVADIAINFCKKYLGGNMSKAEVPESFVNEFCNYILYF
jgi:hypothetical protein